MGDAYERMFLNAARGDQALPLPLTTPDYLVVTTYYCAVTRYRQCVCSAVYSRHVNGM